MLFFGTFLVNIRKIVEICYNFCVNVNEQTEHESCQLKLDIKPSQGQG